MQESITLEAAATPGALSLPDLTSLDPCLEPKKGTIWVTSQPLPSSLKKKEGNLSFEL